jgi:hypothetical protein
MPRCDSTSWLALADGFGFQADVEFERLARRQRDTIALVPSKTAQLRHYQFAGNRKRPRRTEAGRVGERGGLHSGFQVPRGDSPAGNHRALSP